MIYVQEGWKPDDDLPPMNGTRVGHEMMDEDVMCVMVQHAEQSFRSDRRELTILHIIGDKEPETGTEAWTKLTNCAVKTTGRRPLTRPYK